MPREVVSIQVGQCGNEIGNSFWKHIADEIGISSDGQLVDAAGPIPHGLETFFSKADNDRLVPRAVLVDLEPRVINGVTNSVFGNLFNMDRIFRPSDGGGAGNNWAIGYTSGANSGANEQIMNLIRMEAELCDNLDSFSLSHSIAGGTGSGLGSWIVEQLSDEYPNQHMQTFSVFPSSGSDVVVQPYNAILTLHHLLNCADMSVILDNESITQNIVKKMHINQPGMDDVNAIIGRLAAGLTAPMRWGTPMYPSMSAMIDKLVPMSPLNFVQCGIAPLQPLNSRVPQRTAPADLMSALTRPDAILTSAFNKSPPSSNDCLLAGLAVFQGDVKHRTVSEVMSAVNYKCPFGSLLMPLNDIESCITFPQAKSRSAVLAINHSSTERIITQILTQYDKMFRNKAYLAGFERENCFDNNLDFMKQARETVGHAAQAYSDPWRFANRQLASAHGEEE